MGAEAKCTVTFRGKRATGTARLETNVLQFRGGDLRLTIPFKTMTKIAVDKDRLTISSREGTATFALGIAAEKWAHKIKNPPSRLEKLGVRPDWRASVIGGIDQTLLRELEAAVAYLCVGRVARDSDAIFLCATSADQLSRLAALKRSLKPNGAIWVIRPKGRPEISERAVMAAGRRAGLVDVKVASLSPTHTAEKFVIPLAKR